MLMKQQQRRKPLARGPGGNNNNNKAHHQTHKTHYNNNSNSNNTNNNSNSSKAQKAPQVQTPIIITTIFEYPQPITYGSLEYPLPTLCHAHPTPRVINSDLPRFKTRPAAVCESGELLLQSTFLQTSVDQSDESTQRRFMDSTDPAMKIVMQLKKESSKTVWKLGSMEVVMNSSGVATSNKGGDTMMKKVLVNKFLQKDGLSTPLKRNRDELVEVNSSLKKNRRMHELSMVDDTTMELSFEGKAMDKSDLVKLVDDSSIMMQDVDMSHYDLSHVNGVIDTRNLLQSTEFSFEYKR